MKKIKDNSFILMIVEGTPMYKNILEQTNGKPFIFDDDAIRYIDVIQLEEISTCSMLIEVEFVEEKIATEKFEKSIQLLSEAKEMLSEIVFENRRSIHTVEDCKKLIIEIGRYINNQVL